MTIMFHLQSCSRQSIRNCHRSRSRRGITETGFSGFPVSFPFRFDFVVRQLGEQNLPPLPQRRTVSSTVYLRRLQAVRIPLSIWRAFAPVKRRDERISGRCTDAADEGGVEDDAIVRAMCRPGLAYPLSNFVRVEVLACRRNVSSAELLRVREDAANTSLTAAATSVTFPSTSRSSRGIAGDSRDRT